MVSGTSYRYEIKSSFYMHNNNWLMSTALFNNNKTAPTFGFHVQPSILSYNTSQPPRPGGLKTFFFFHHVDQNQLIFFQLDQNTLTLHNLVVATRSTIQQCSTVLDDGHAVRVNPNHPTPQKKNHIYYRYYYYYHHSLIKTCIRLLLVFHDFLVFI